MSRIRSLWILARPRLGIYVLSLVAAGYGWAHWDRALTGRGGWSFCGVLVAWGLLHAGTLWLNAELDQDEGEVLMGQSVVVPPGTTIAAFLALLLCVLIAAAAHPVSGVAALLCAVLSVLYSHPRTAWKGHPLGGPLVNLVGYGVLSPIAGFAVTGVSVNTRTLCVGVLMAAGVLASYFAAQAFQQEEDSARGYRTLVATHGPRTVILAARFLLGLGWLGAVVMSIAGWLPRICLVGAPLYLWVDRWFVLWARQPGGGTERWARTLGTRLVTVGVVGMGLVSAEYVWASYRGSPVAGLGTTAGHPPDRPVATPAVVRVWEKRCAKPSHELREWCARWVVEGRPPPLRPRQ